MSARGRDGLDRRRSRRRLAAPGRAVPRCCSVAPDHDAAAPPARAALATRVAGAGAARGHPREPAPDGPLSTPGCSWTRAPRSAPRPARTAPPAAAAAPGAGAPRELRRRAARRRTRRSSAFAVSGDDLVWTESAAAAPVRSGRRTPGGAARPAHRGHRRRRLLRLPVRPGDRGRPGALGRRGRRRARRPRSARCRSPAARSRPRASPAVVADRLAVADRRHGDRPARPCCATRRPAATCGWRPPAPELTHCTPAWCRVMVLSGDGLARIDLMHPDGSARPRIAGGGAQARRSPTWRCSTASSALRVRAGLRPDRHRGAAGLRHRHRQRRSTVTPAATGAFSRGGVLWWSTGDQDTFVWHTLDLRTV